MRVLLSKLDRLKLFNQLKKNNACSSMKELAKKMNIPLKTLQTWIYDEQRYLPEKILSDEIKGEIKMLDQREEGWGRVLGGKKTYRLIIERYGKGEMLKRQIAGGKALKSERIINEVPFALDIPNNKFLEFYGVLLGDGWLSRLKYKKKNIWLIGIAGDKRLDKEFYIYLKKNIKELFNREAYIKERKYNNSMEINFSHKMLIKALNEELGFPIGKKIDLEINLKIYSLGYDKMKNVIRGIFDTDGSFYFDKTSSGAPYPCISIEMKAPKLIRQVYDMLIMEGFKVSYKIGKNEKKEHHRITLKGRKQLDKWMQEIGSNNQRHLKKCAPVAQPG